MLRSLLICTAVVLCADSARAQVTLTRSPAAIEHHSFNPRNPPREMPKLQPKETAVTQSYFGSSASVGGSVIETHKASDGTYEASVRVGKIDMKLRMSVTIWLPENPIPKIVNHEEGHRKIAEHFYDQAEPIARKEAEAMIGQTVTGTGRDAQSAIDNAFDNIIQIVGKRYLEKCEVPCGKAQEIYDQITANGTNPVKEAQAVDQAIGRAMDDAKAQ